MWIRHCQMCMISSSACLVPFVLAGFLSSTHLSHVADPDCWQSDARECLLGGVVVWSLAKDKTLERSHCEVMSLRPTGKKKKKSREKTCGAWIQMYCKKTPNKTMDMSSSSYEMFFSFLFFGRFPCATHLGTMSRCHFIGLHLSHSSQNIG